MHKTKQKIFITCFEISNINILLNIKKGSYNIDKRQTTRIQRLNIYNNVRTETKKKEKNRYLLVYK